jgi:sulfur-carrier protein
LIKVYYFARLRENLNYSVEEMPLPDDVKDVAGLKQHLAKRGDVWQTLFTSDQQIRCAINHALVDEGATILDGDEVAFFPPVTGG